MPEVKVYNKLVRDNIPNIIKNAGATPVCRILKRKEFIKELKNKILEEAQKLVETKKKKTTINELIDIQELVDVLRREIDMPKQKFELLQMEKRKIRGGFENRMFLIETEK